MNKRGTPSNLVASHPGNSNAVQSGVHSPRLIQARAAEITVELSGRFSFSPTEALAVHEVARCIAILEAIDRDLDERGLVDRTGKARYLLGYRSRLSRQLDRWLSKVSDAIERQASDDEPAAAAGRGAYVRELERIALGRDSSATARDRLSAIKELLRLDEAASAQQPQAPLTLHVHLAEDGTVLGATEVESNDVESAAADGAGR